MTTVRRVVSRVREFAVRERGRIALFFGILLVGVVSFEAGFLSGVARSSQPLVVNVPVEANVSGGQVAGSSTESAVPSDAGAKAVPDASGCAFIGSRNSTLYHRPTCAVAKRIKPENVVCFTSAEDAQSKGYRAGCIK